MFLKKEDEKLLKTLLSGANLKSFIKKLLRAWLYIESKYLCDANKTGETAFM